MFSIALLNKDGGRGLQDTVTEWKIVKPMAHTNPSTCKLLYWGCARDCVLMNTYHTMYRTVNSNWTCYWDQSITINQSVGNFKMTAHADIMNTVLFTSHINQIRELIYWFKNNHEVKQKEPAVVPLNHYNHVLLEYKIDYFRHVWAHKDHTLPWNKNVSCNWTKKIDLVWYILINNNVIKVHYYI